MYKYLRIFIQTFSAAGPLDKSLVQTLIDAEELKMSDRMTKVKTLMDELKVILITRACLHFVVLYKKKK